MIDAIFKEVIDGQEYTFINPAKDAVKPIWHGVDTANNQVALAANGSLITTLTVFPEENLRGDSELYKILSTHTGPYTLSINHLGINKLLMNQPIHVSMVAGTAQLPFTMFESLFVETNQSLQLIFSDISGAPNTIFFNMYGRRFIAYDIPGMAKEKILYEAYSRKTHPYWLTFDQPLVIAANATATGNMSLTGEADMEVWQFLNASTGAFQFEIFEGRSGRPITSFPVHSANGFGTTGVSGSGQFPFLAIESWLVKRQTTLRFRITDLSGAPNTIRVALHGRLIYYQERGRAPIQLMDRPRETRRMATRGAGIPPGTPRALLGPLAGR